MNTDTDTNIDKRTFMEVIREIKASLPFEAKLFNVETFLIEQGVRQIIKLLKSQYLDSYEIFLINKYKDSNELLIKYYKFIGCFDIYPSENDCPNEIYKDVVDNLTMSEMRNIKNEVIDVMRRNKTQNSQELRKKIRRLIQMDKEFQWGDASMASPDLIFLNS